MAAERLVHGADAASSPRRHSAGGGAAGAGRSGCFCSEQRELLLHGLELTDRSAELLALLRVGDRKLERGLKRTSDLRRARERSVVEEVLRLATVCGRRERWRGV